MQDYDYDVTLSFAGEDRDDAEELARLLKNNQYRVFYDKYELSKLWGENLYDYLSDIYKNKSNYCIIFVSKHYAQKAWANHERQSAQSRAFTDSGTYILPIILDDTEIPGILPTIGYLDRRTMTIKEIFKVLVEKLTEEPSNVGFQSRTISTDEDNFAEYILLSSVEGKLNFIPLQDLRRDSEKITFELLPESSESISFLRSLQDTIRNQFSRSKFIGCAYRDEASWVIPFEIIENSTNWEVSLSIYDTQSNLGSLFGFNSDIARMRAERILLNVKLDSTNPMSINHTGLDQTVSEIQIRGIGSSTNEPNIQVLESPIPLLYQQFKATPAKFLPYARLLSVFYLKLSNTIDKILRLDLELEHDELVVDFKGFCPKIYSNEEPILLEFEGICELSG